MSPTLHPPFTSEYYTQTATFSPFPLPRPILMRIFTAEYYKIMETETVLLILVIYYLFGTFLVTNAAKEHQCDMMLVVLASIILSPIGGLLYVLCFPPKR